jgi:hypothetical protein
MWFGFDTLKNEVQSAVGAELHWDGSAVQSKNCNEIDVVDTFYIQLQLFASKPLFLATLHAIMRVAGNYVSSV